MEDVHHPGEASANRQEQRRDRAMGTFRRRRLGRADPRLETRPAVCHQGAKLARPTPDSKRGLLYVPTGDNFSPPATNMSDSVVALELATGRVAWSKQTLPGDVWN